MPIKFTPIYRINAKIATCLMRIEAIKEKILHLPLTPKVLANLRETARLITTHYSTMIEGNKLGTEQVTEVIKHQGHFPGRERDENEVKAYYTALATIEKWAAANSKITEDKIKILHALIMADGRAKVRPTPYRTGQNVIRDGHSRAIVYMPPEAKDVAKLMKELIRWINSNKDLPYPLIAGIAHYQFATIHPYFDGNGRTARLLTTWILHANGYDLKGLYSLEEYYARNLGAYYHAISIGPSHNYYFGRREADITSWVEYFIEGVAVSFEKIFNQMHAAEFREEKNQEIILRTLDPKQRKALELFQQYETVTAKQIGELFGFKSRTTSALCKKWVGTGFLKIFNTARKSRSYQLARGYQQLILK